MQDTQPIYPPGQDPLWEDFRAYLRAGGPVAIHEDAAPGMPGVRRRTATFDEWPCPLAELFYRVEQPEWAGGEPVLSLCYVWVHDELRRCGLASRLFCQVIQRDPVTRYVVTGRGSAESRPWLAHHGFEWDPERLWVWDREAKAP